MQCNLLREKSRIKVENRNRLETLTIFKKIVSVSEQNSLFFCFLHGSVHCFGRVVSRPLASIHSSRLPRDLPSLNQSSSFFPSPAGARSESVDSVPMFAGSSSSLASSVSEDVEKHLNVSGSGIALPSAASADMLRSSPSDGSVTTKTMLRLSSSDQQTLAPSSKPLTASPVTAARPADPPSSPYLNENKKSQVIMRAADTSGSARPISRISKRRSFSSFLRRSDSKSSRSIAEIEDSKH